MSDVVLSVSKLTKRYPLGKSTQHTEPYVALRDVLSQSLERVGRSMLNTFLPKSASSPIRKEDFWALRDISFEIKRGDIVGIIGRNGAGKSTLLKILSRITEPTSGRVEIKGRIASLLEVGTGFHPELTGRENIMLNGAILGMRRAEIRKKFDAIVAFAEVEKFLDTPVKRYSSGMYVRLAFAIAAHLEPEILVVDEVLAVGDAEFQKRCLGKMQDVAGQGRTVLFVSHNMGVISTLCHKCLLLDKGSLEAFSDTSSVIRQYEQNVQKLIGKTDLPAGYISLRPIRDQSLFSITSVQLSDTRGQPIQVAESLEDVTFTINYHAPRLQRSGSVALFIKSLNGTVLLRSATSPDSNISMDIQQGVGTIRCLIKALPLPPGEYVLSVGLAIPMREWLCLEEELCLFQVALTDVKDNGFIPQQKHAAALAHCIWST